MMHLFLEAADLWLFRDGRPFDARSHHRAESLFPPYPTTIQGALRSYELVRPGRTPKIDLHDPQAVIQAVGTATNYGKLRIRGPFLTIRSMKNGKQVYTRCYPQPADACTLDKEKNILHRASLPQESGGKVKTNLPAPATRLIGLQDREEKPGARLWLAEDQLLNYFNGKEAEGIPEEKLFVREVNPGIGVDSARQAVITGALFEVSYIRPLPDVGLLLEVDGYTWQEKRGVLTLGGEHRAARFEQVTAAAFPQAPSPLPPRWMVYFATPAYFENGWLPGKGWENFFKGSAKVELVAAAVARYESVGGFDYAEKKQPHKTARRYVPAGSVYYFEAKGGGSVQLNPDLCQQAITEDGAEIGFGQIIIKEW